MPQFRESNHNGLVGLRGYMNYFQDTATYYMHNLGKGNDTLPEEYGISWIYTKYKMHIVTEADFTGPLQFEMWAEKSDRPKLCTWQDFVISKGDNAYAYGRIESCLYHMQSQRLCKLEAIDYPVDETMGKEIPLNNFTKLSKRYEEMEYCYTETVRYTDLDKSKHMNNLLYINLFLNSFDSGFYEKYKIKDFEIHYLKQCYEKEELDIFRKINDHVIELAVVKKDGTVVTKGILEVEVYNR
jgi:acyl-ACP thioesterase